MRLAARRCAVTTDSGNMAAARLDRDFAENGMRAPLDLRTTVSSSLSAVIHSASPGSSTQTRLERLPGSGTSVNGPLGVWNSVEMLLCSRVCANESVNAIWRYLRSSVAMPAALRQSERRPSAPIDERRGQRLAALDAHRDRIGRRLNRGYLVVDNAQR